MTEQNSPNNIQSQQPPVPQRKKFDFWRWFWLSFLVVSVSWAWYSFYAPANNVAWSKDYASAQQVAAKSGKPTILFFTGAWCSPCRIMKRQVWADKQVEDTVNASFAAVIIDVDDPKAAAQLSRYQVRATPTTVIVDPDGNVLQRVEGGMDKKAFLAMLAEIKPSTTDLLE